MIRTDNRNASVDEQESMGPNLLTDYTKSRGTLAGEDEDTKRRLAVGKSKSVGHINLYSHRGNGGIAMPASLARIGFGSDSSKKPTRSHSKMDARTVKSETAYFSPRKPAGGILSAKAVEDDVTKKSPSSIFDFDLQPEPERTGSEKKLGISISSHERSVLQLFPGFDNSHQTLSMSGSFSDEETIDASFANDDLASIPTSFRQSTSSISVPSDLTGSTPTLDLPFSSPSRQTSRTYAFRSPNDHPSSVAATCSTSDIIPLPPRRQNSNPRSFRHNSDACVPHQIQCFPIDASPMKPSRQTSVKRLFAQQGSSASSSVTSLSINLSPTKPKRQSSSDSLAFDAASHHAFSCMSIDSSPLKPERQKSIRFEGSTRNTTTRARSSTSGPKKRTISRSESTAQTRLPALSRRDSISEEFTEDKRSARQASITKTPAQEAGWNRVS